MMPAAAAPMKPRMTISKLRSDAMLVMALNTAQARTAKEMTRNLPKRSPKGP